MKQPIIKIVVTVFWILMTVTLLFAGILVCGVRLLTPQRLTPVIERLANKNLNADVSLGRASLTFDPAFPVLKLRLDSLTIVSKAFDNLDAEARAALPCYSDSLFSLQSFVGTVDIGALLSRGEISVRNVTLTRPAVNIVLDVSGRGNFDIFASDTTSIDSKSNAGAPLPPFSVGKFSIVEPRELRYYNAADSTEAAVLQLNRTMLDGSGNPVYALDIDGSLVHPALAELLGENCLHFGLDGNIRWESSAPQMIAFEQFTIQGAFIRAGIDAALDFDSTLTVGSGRLQLGPVSVSRAVALLPDDMKKEYRLDSINFRTDAAVSIDAELTRPFRIDRDTIPYARIKVNMPDASVKYGKAVLDRAGADIGIDLCGNNLDSATVTVNRLEAAGPATSINLRATVDRLIADPRFKADIKADVALGRLPEALTHLLNGVVDGRLRMEMTAGGTASMFEQDKFHSLDVTGCIKGEKLFYLSTDTAVMAQVDGLDIDFGSQMRLSEDQTRTLAASIAADTANILIDGITVRASKFALGAGVENAAPTADTTMVLPMGGTLKIGRLDVESITDTAGVRLRQVNGKLTLTRFKENKKQPQLQADLSIRRLAAGTVDTRFMLSNASVNATMHKRIRRNSEAYKDFKRRADSLRTVYPELSPDSVYALALAKRRHHGKRQPRIHTTMTDNDTEMLDWGLSKGFSRFLLDWDLNGNISTRSARLFTPLFPLRNRVRRLDLAFTSDSVVLRSVRYRAGNSDMKINGSISNLRRGLTSKRPGNAVKINFNISSDTIDVNQLAAATFSGAAYAERIRRGEQRISTAGHSDASEEALDSRFDALSAEPTDTAAILIPGNIDARIKVEASNVLYSDLALNNLKGEVLMYKGAVNLHDIAATSDAGSVSLSALYAAPRASDIHFGFGLDLKRFKIERFLKLVPAVDSIMPLMRDFSGIINADIAATVDIDSAMNMVLPTLDAAVRLTGDSLALINPDTYRTLGKWLRFKDKTDNRIKHMNVEILVRDNYMQIFPFEFDIDRYRLGVSGNNDLALNFKYHIAVLRSPLPFKFGINISGNPDKYKVRFGGAKFKDGMAAEKVDIVDTARVNLIQQIENVFRRGVAGSRFARVKVSAPKPDTFDEPDRGLSAADSLTLIKEGLIEAPAAIPSEGDGTRESPADDADNLSDNKKATLPDDRKRKQAQ